MKNSIIAAPTVALVLLGGLAACSNSPKTATAAARSHTASASPSSSYPVTLRVCAAVKDELAPYVSSSGVDFPDTRTELSVGQGLLAQAQSIPDAETAPSGVSLKSDLAVFAQQLITAGKGGPQPGSSNMAGSVNEDCFKLTGTDVLGAAEAPAGSSGSAPAAGSSSSAAAPTMTRQTDEVVFKVWGSGYPSIQYGSDSDSNSPKGGYGPLGDGNALPWSASMTYDANALYYAVSAQLEGSGDISDSVTEVITTSCSDGSHKTESFPLAHAHASGGYNIAQAEYTGGDTGNTQQAESDVGC